MIKNRLKYLFVWSVLACISVEVLAKSKASSQVDQAIKPSTSESTPMDQVLIKVDENLITSREYASFLQAHPKLISQAMTTEVGKAMALKELVSGYLLRKAMYDEGLISPQNKDVSQKETVEAYEKLAERHFPLPKSPNDEEAHAYYKENSSNYGISAMLRLNEILIKVDPKADSKVKQAGRERASKVLELLAAGKPFSDIANQYTENPIGKITKGDIGFIDPDKHIWMKQAVGSMNIGERTGVIESPEGFVILQVTDIRPAVISPYANVREKVIEDMRHAEQEKLRAPYVASLAGKSKIEVVSPYIQPLFPNGIFPKP